MNSDDMDQAPGLFDWHADELAALPPVRLPGVRELAADARRSRALTSAAEYARGAEHLGYEPDDLPPSGLATEEYSVFWLAANVGFLEVVDGFFALEPAFAWPGVPDARAVEMWAEGMYGVIVENVTDQLQIDLLDELLDQDDDDEHALPNFNDAFHGLVPTLLVALLREPDGMPVSELRWAAVEKTGQPSWNAVVARQGDPLAPILRLLVDYGAAVVENSTGHGTGNSGENSMVRLTPLGLYGTVFHIRQDGLTVRVAD
ncbi:hypothetical protein [Nonomuraea sp. SBT364]|uniref:hypothetical protein n=1 Tax=Nonomuraea sp. SBT364 TaxID=1580530 RepID=UPI000A79B437|nr:hypothetical protein [Nonomuraea sp. SBT364]